MEIYFTASFRTVMKNLKQGMKNLKQQEYMQ